MVCLYHEHLGRNASPPWACTCQPPTVWGPTLMYHCECCDQPRSALRYMLCPDCQKHEYAHFVTVQSDHQQLDEDEDLALPALRGGEGFLMPTHKGT